MTQTSHLPHSPFTPNTEKLPSRRCTSGPSPLRLPRTPFVPPSRQFTPPNLLASVPRLSGHATPDCSNQQTNLSPISISGLDSFPSLPASRSDEGNPRTETPATTREATPSTEHPTPSPKHPSSESDTSYQVCLQCQEPTNHRREKVKEKWTVCAR